MDKLLAPQSDGNEIDAPHGHDLDFNISIPIDDIYLEYLLKHVTMIEFPAKWCYDQLSQLERKIWVKEVYIV